MLVEFQVQPALVTQASALYSNQKERELLLFAIAVISMSENLQRCPIMCFFWLIQWSFYLFKPF